MPKNKRQDELIVEERRSRIADLYCRRQSMRQIVAATGVSIATVSRDLAVLRQRWRERSLAATSERAAEELARIDHLEEVAWEAWQRSCQNRETLRAAKTKGRTDKNGSLLPDLEKTEKIAVGQAGDPRFLERVGWCIQKRAEMLGILQPETSGAATITTVVNSIDLSVVLGRSAGLSLEQIGGVSSN